MQQLLDTASWPKAAPHSFRHTFKIKMRNLGIPIKNPRVQLNHTTSSVIKINTYPNLEVAKEVIN